MSKDKLYQLKSFALTFASDFLVEGAVFLMMLYDGNFSKAVFSGLATAVFRTAFKMAIRAVDPSFFTGQNNDQSIK